MMTYDEERGLDRQRDLDDLQRARADAADEAGACRDREAHNAHMMMNGECPWCGAYDPPQIVEGIDPEVFG